MDDRVTLVGNVAVDQPGDSFSELVVTLEDGATVVVVSEPDTVEIVTGKRAVKAGDRVAVRGAIITRGKGPHPVSVSAIRIAVAAAGEASVTNDNRLCALVDDDPEVRHGGHAPALDVPRRKRRRGSAAGALAGRAPYYRTGSVLAVTGALVGGAALASWGSAGDVLTRPPPAAWAGAGMLYAMFAFLAASAISAGRAPFELGTGKFAGGTGRPPWAISSPLIVLGLALAFPGGIYFVEATRASLRFLAVGFGIGAAAAGGFLVFDAWKMRAHYGFAWRLLRGRGSTAVVEGGALDRRVVYQHKKRSYETTERDKDGNTRFVTRTERWIEGVASTSGDETLVLRAEGETTELSVRGLTWSAPVRYLPGTTTNELTSITVIGTGTEIIVSDDRRLAFAAGGSARAAVTLFGLVLGHAVRLATLALIAGAAAYLASRLGALS